MESLMIGQEVWKKLKNLVSIDKKILDYQSKRQIALNIIKENQLEIPVLKKKEDLLKSKIFELKKKLDLLELEFKTLKLKEDNKKQQLETLHNSKEFKALEKELAKLTLNLKKQEDIIETKWVELENLQRSLESLTIKNEETLKQLNESIADQEGFIEQLNKHLKAIQSDRNVAIQDIPKEWLVKYEKMRSHTSNPIVPITNQTCSACFYPVLPQDIAKLKAGEVLLCRNCYRFLYYNTEEESNLSNQIS